MTILNSKDGSAEVMRRLVSSLHTSTTDSALEIIPMDDCMIEIRWSFVHNRLVAFIKEIPCKD